MGRPLGGPLCCLPHAPAGPTAIPFALSPAFLRLSIARRPRIAPQPPPRNLNLAAQLRPPARPRGHSPPDMQPAAAAAGLRHQRPGGRLAATPPVRPAARRCRPAEAYQGGLQQGGAPAASSTDTEVADIIHLAKHRLAKKTTAPPEGGIAEFFHKARRGGLQVVGSRLRQSAVAAWRRVHACSWWRRVRQPGSGGSALAAPSVGSRPAAACCRTPAAAWLSASINPRPLIPHRLQVQLAWRVFFPEQQRLMTPKEEGKQRLRMILVADR